MRVREKKTRIQRCVFKLFHDFKTRERERWMNEGSGYGGVREDGTDGDNGVGGSRGCKEGGRGPPPPSLPPPPRSPPPPSLLTCAHLEFWSEV